MELSLSPCCRGLLCRIISNSLDGKKARKWNALGHAAIDLGENGSVLGLGRVHPTASGQGWGWLRGWGPVDRPYTKSEKSQEDLAKEATIQYWLFKSEPDAWSWDQQKKEGAKGAEWDGVRNYQARNVMRQMKKGDLGFFYHSGEERRVVGVVKVVAEAHPDSTDGTGIWECVDVAAVSAVKKPVTLAKIKATKSLKDMVLVTIRGFPCNPFPPGNGFQY